MPAVLGGLLTVWLVFVCARRWFGDTAGLLALLFVATSPIHILYSRQVHAGTYLPPLFAMLILYLLDRWLESHSPSLACSRGTMIHRRTWRSASGGPSAGLTMAPSPLTSRVLEFRWLALAGLAIGFSTNAYTGSRITALMFALMSAGLVVVVVGIRRGQRRIASVSLVVLTVAVLVGAAPTIYAASAMPDSFFSRSAHIMPPLANGPRWWLDTLIANLAANLDPRYLFLSFGEYRHLSVERLGIASLPFLYVGLLGLIITGVRRRSLRLGLIPVTVLIGLAPGVLSTGNPNPMRTSVVWAIYPIASAYGVVLLGRLIRRLLARRTGGRPTAAGNPAARPTRFGLVAVSLGIVCCSAFYTFRYVDDDALHGLAAQQNYVAIGNWLRDHGKGYDRVYIDVDGVFGYLYVAALSGMTPAEFQQAPREGTVTAMGWDYVDRLGRYYFQSAEAAQEAWRGAPHKEKWLLIQGLDAMTELTPDTHVTITVPSTDAP